MFAPIAARKTLSVGGVLAALGCALPHAGEPLGHDLQPGDLDLPRLRKTKAFWKSVSLGRLSNNPRCLLERDDAGHLEDTLSEIELCGQEHPTFQLQPWPGVEGVYVEAYQGDKIEAPKVTLPEK